MKRYLLALVLFVPALFSLGNLTSDTNCYMDFYLPKIQRDTITIAQFQCTPSLYQNDIIIYRKSFSRNNQNYLETRFYVLEGDSMLISEKWLEKIEANKTTMLAYENYVYKQEGLPNENNPKVRTLRKFTQEVSTPLKFCSVSDGSISTFNYWDSLNSHSISRTFTNSLDYKGSNQLKSEKPSSAFDTLDLEIQVKSVDSDISNFVFEIVDTISYLYKMSFLQDTGMIKMTKEFPFATTFTFIKVKNISLEDWKVLEKKQIK